MDRLKILAPVDFTDLTELMVAHLINLKQFFDVEVELLHVMELNIFSEVNSEGHFDDYMGISSEVLEVQQKAAKENLARLHARLKEEFEEVSAHIKLGPLTDTILSFAEKQRVDMILMGTKAGEKMKAWFRGSETRIIARRSEIPVLTIMCHPAGNPFSNMLFISDFDDLDVAPDPLIGTLARGFGAKLHILHICREGAGMVDAKRQEIVEYAERYHLPAPEIHIIEDKKVLDGIHHFDQLQEMNLLALGTHGRKGIQHLLRGSIAEGLIGQLHKPVLVYKI